MVCLISACSINMKALMKSVFSFEGSSTKSSSCILAVFNFKRNKQPESCWNRKTASQAFLYIKLQFPACHTLSP